ncbi:MAG: tetratricopeptide repeat protein [Ktedonobacteraceae bacterium]|nr:tetratricopeptide repeat protein [Ktedonobacteraceae bacterium]
MVQFEQQEIISGEFVRQFRVREHFSQQTLAMRLGIHRNTIARWEQGDYLPKTRVALHELAQVLRLNDQESNQLLEAAFFSKDEPPDHPVAAAVWTVPYPRNVFFTGRDEILHKVHTRLSRDHTMALTQPWAVSGLGGIGKTQIALEYAYRYRHEYRFVFWLSAATQETLLSSLVMIAELLQLPEQDSHDHTRLMRAVKAWFASQQQWLMILDNVEDIAMLQSLLPAEHAGHVLLTTRAQALGSLVQRIEVETMGMAEATLFLLHRAGILAPEASLDQAMQAHLNAAEAIAIEMDFLPLALDQAGAYIEEVGCSLSTYLNRYQTHRKELLQRRGLAPSNHPESVTTTWSLSFQTIEQTNPGAAELLRFCAFLEPDAIPEELINEGSAYLGPILGPVATDAFKVDEAIQQLRVFSLVQRDPEARLLRVHRLVQAVLKDTMKAEDVQQWAERVVRITGMVFPSMVEKATWPQCQRYLPQAQECAVLIQDYGFTFEEAASLLFRTASYVQEYALYEQAEQLYQQALRIWEHILGPDHVQVASALQRLAQLAHDRGRYEHAEPLYQRALAIREQALGADHPYLAHPLNGLAKLYMEQGKYEQAAPLYQHALAIREQHLGQHPDKAETLHDFAILSVLQENYPLAEDLYRRALVIREHVLGPHHPTTLETRERLQTALGVLDKTHAVMQGNE